MNLVEVDCERVFPRRSDHGRVQRRSLTRTSRLAHLTLIGNPNFILCPVVKMAPGADDRHYACYILERRFEARCTSSQLRLAASGLGCSASKFQGS